MSRYMCVYFIAKDEISINKENKRTKVLDCLSAGTVMNDLVTIHNATHIKSIRDLENPRYYLYNSLLNKIEQLDNNNLEYNEREKKYKQLAKNSSTIAAGIFSNGPFIEALLEAADDEPKVVHGTIINLSIKIAKKINKKLK